MVLFCRKRGIVGIYRSNIIVEVKLHEYNIIGGGSERIAFLLVEPDTGNVVKELTLEEVKRIKKGG